MTIFVYQTVERFQQLQRYVFVFSERVVSVWNSLPALGYTSIGVAGGWGAVSVDNKIDRTAKRSVNCANHCLVYKKKQLR